MSPKPDLFTKQPHGHCLDWEKPGRSAQPVAASRRNPFDSSSARLENRACWRTSRCNIMHRTGSGNRPQIAIRAACDGKRISPCRRVGSGESSMAAGEDRRLKTRTASCQNQKILPFLHSASRFWHTRCGLSGRCFRCCGCW